ncbi:MAG: aminotransferase class I/II-fold pyridoxal phosphate-dependent enzyme [Pseudomonadota bacterium]
MKRPSNAPLRPVINLGQSRPVATPIHPSVVYASEDLNALDEIYFGQAEGYTYSREGHPNAQQLAQMIDEMEGAEGGIITGSGMSAVLLAVLSCAASGDHVLGGDQLYGRSLRMMSDELPRLGIAAEVVDTTDSAQVEAALKPNTKAILLEVVSNPTLRIADMEGIYALEKARGIKVIVDNTFTTPAAYQPLQVGADLVVHSVTKLLAGHSDAMLGYVAAGDPALNDEMRVRAITWGLTGSPFDCWLAERGALSFGLRYAATTQNAQRLATALSDHPSVAQVLYPSRQDHPQADRARRLLGDKGGNMVSFRLNADARDPANTFVRALDAVPCAPTLGDIGTTLSHPATSSHRALTSEARAALGMGEGFFRVSVGIEPIESLVDVFTNALDQIQD